VLDPLFRYRLVGVFPAGVEKKIGRIADQESAQ
jgi:hypothetical protein